MSKKRKSQPSRSARGPLPRRALVTLQDAVWLSDRREYDTAREKLETLNKQFPHQPDILFPLLEVLYDLKDMAAYQDVAEQLVELVLDNADLLLNLAGSCLTNMRPVSALDAFRKFLTRYPHHPRAAETQQRVAELEAKLPELLADLGPGSNDPERIAVLHERSLALLERGEHQRARRVVEELLILQPDFIPALNNSSNLSYVEGDLVRAAETARRVLEREPENIQALSNLTRFLLLQGRVQEAESVAATLKTIDSERTDVEVKQVEALAMLGDDAGVLQVFERAEKRGRLGEPFAHPMLFHAAGVAALRQGDEKRAKKLWQRALDIAPSFAITRENLEDLKKPIGERHAPWAFTFAEWVPQKTIRDLVERIQPVTGRGEKAITHAAHRFFREHPEVVGLIPLLLARGDLAGRTFAFQLAMAFDAPEMKTALRDFALGVYGPDKLRMEAAQAATRAGLIPSGNVRMYLRGEWSEVLLLDMEIHGEPDDDLLPATRKLTTEAFHALNDGDAVRAESLLLQADALEPNEATIRHNLAMAYQMQGQNEKAEALLRENHAQHPDYLFARAVLARLAVQHKRLDEAEELLEPLMSQKRFHFSEFAAFAGAQIDLRLARGDAESARSWFDMWTSIDPENPQLDLFRAKFSPLGRLFRR